MAEYEFDPAAPWDDCGDEDPDSHSPRLRYYHQRLWSGRLLAGRADGRTLALHPLDKGLIDTGLGENFFGFDQGLYLASDRVVPTWSYWTETSALRDDPGIQQRALEADPVLDNMGGILMFPGWQIEGHLTLNQARGFSQKARIGDRVDLTLECILRGYRGDFDWEDNPLGPTIERYWQFFELFGDFRGYVAFWMLEDLLTVDGQRVNFLMEADVPGGWDFASRSPLPASADAYDEYLGNARTFVLRRNERMSQAWEDGPDN